jgi:signal transduction histidine kinase
MQSIKQRLLIFLGIWVLLAPMHASADVPDDWIQAHGVWEDVAGEATLQDATQAAYQPYQSIYSRGYTTHPIWFRFEIRARTANESDHIWLRIRPSYIEKIELFDPLLADPQTAGYQRTLAQHYDSGNIYFRIPTSMEPRKIYMRSESSGDLSLFLGAHVGKDIAALDRIQERWSGAYMALVFATIVWGLLYWLQNRSRLFFIFTTKQILSFVFAIGFLGYYPSLPWPAGIENYLRVLQIVTLLFVASMFWFSAHLLNDYPMPRWFAWFRTGSYVFIALLVLLALSGEASHAMELNIAFLLITQTLFWVVSWWYRPPIGSAGDRGRFSMRNIVFLYFTANALLVSIFGLPRLDLVRGSEVTFYLPLLYALVSGFAMMALLYLRQRALDEDRLREVELRMLAEQEISLQRLARDEQVRLFGLLAHELRNPMATIRMAAGMDRLPASERKQQISAAVDKMNEMLSRCLSTDRWADQAEPSEMRTIGLRALLKALLSDIDVEAEVFDFTVRLHESDPASVLADEQFLEIAFSNLLQNAVRYRAEHSRVSVHLSSSPGPGAQPGYLVVVTNLPGQAGMPDPDLVFQKFYRSRGAQSQAGSGLGLHLTRKLIQQLDGYVVYVPSQQKVLFEVWLPKAKTIEPA